MATEQASTEIACSADEFLEFVLDIRAYARVDDKIGTIRSVRRTGDEVVFTFSPRLLGLPGPPTTQRVTRSGDRIDIAPVPSWVDRVLRFSASFVCTPAPGGVTVTRRLAFDLVRPLSWVLDPLLARWLAKDVPRELAAAKAHLEQAAAA